MDLEMPGIGGAAAARMILDGQGPNRHTPILALTASVMEDDQRRMVDAGMSGMIRKPVYMKDLTAVLDRVFVAQ
jgi:CheY-like chemotaxis protein